MADRRDFNFTLFKYFVEAAREHAAVKSGT
jgi:hypothetical protein